MLTLHPHFLVDEAGRQVAVQVAVVEYRSLVLAAYEAGRVSEGQAAELLGVTRPEFYGLAAAAGVSTCSYTQASMEAELANL